MFESIGTGLTLIELSAKVNELRNLSSRKKVQAFLNGLEAHGNILQSHVLQNLKDELGEDRLNQSLLSEVTRARSDWEAEAIGKALSFVASKADGDHDMFWPLVHAIQILLPKDYEPLNEGFAIHIKMKSEGSYNGTVNENVSRLRELFSYPGIKQRYFAAGLAVRDGELGPGDIKLSNELPSLLIEALSL